MITIAILEQNAEKALKMKELLVTYSIQKNMDFRTLWFSTEGSVKKLEKYISGIHIALVSLENNDGLQEGMSIYSLNPDCRIFYYSSGPCRLQPLFHSRPIEFHFWMENDNILVEKLDAVVNELMHSNATFHYKTRKKLLLIPERHILYLQSNLKNVEIHKIDEEDETVFAKLSDLESKLSYRFVRIHQSFIVNIEYIRSIRRDMHMVTLENGEDIPISDARYQSAASSIEKYKKIMF